jgi:phosphoribosylanthranilate isomerase
MLEKLNNLGCARYVVTDVESDGALSGPNFDLLKKVADSTNALIIASGGVSTVDDLQKLRQLNLDGVIVGKALYSGQIDLQLALSACYK